MTDKIKKEWEDLYDNLMTKPKRIFEIFSDYFGKTNVDIQGFYNKEEFCRKKLDGNGDLKSLISSDSIFILVWFPIVKVTNENDKYVYIQDLYVKIIIDVEGTLIGKFYLNRATYPISHIMSGYCHSHVPSINIYNLSNFMKPCTGNGPINATIAILNAEYDEDLWQLFCSEIEDFVQVESLKGVPYKKLEDIGINQFLEIDQKFYYVSRGNYNKIGESLQDYRRNGKIILDFTRYLFKTVSIPIEYSNNTYSIGMSYYDFSILISNKFIEWFNIEDNPYRKLFTLQYLISNNFLAKYCIVDNKIYHDYNYNNNTINYNDYEGKFICKFKENEIKLHIINSEHSSRHTAILLLPFIINKIASAICKVINLRYGRDKRKEEFKFDRQTFYL